MSTLLFLLLLATNQQDFQSDSDYCLEIKDLTQKVVELQYQGIPEQQILDAANTIDQRRLTEYVYSFARPTHYEQMRVRRMQLGNIILRACLHGKGFEE